LGLPMLVGAIHESPLQSVLRGMKYSMELGIQEIEVRRREAQVTWRESCPPATYAYPL